jgi:hypothetical protein
LQSFNWLDLGKDQVELQVQRWDGSAFVGGRPTSFEYAEGNWRFAGCKAGEGVPAEVVAARVQAEPPA